VLSSQLYAGPSVQFFGDKTKDNMVTSGKLGYVGGNTKLGISVDKNLQGQVDLNQVLKESDSSLTSADVWLGYKLKNNSSGSKGVKGGGAKLNHQWVDANKDSVHKVFGAYDQDDQGHSKVTVGYGQEKEDLFWSGHLSKGLGSEDVVGDVTTRAYDYGVGGEVGTFIDKSLARVRAGINYEFGTNYSADESRPEKLTVTAGVDKFFQDSPHSISLDVSGNKSSGGNSADNTDYNARVGYHYEFGGNGVFQSANKTKRVRVEIPGKPARAAIPAVAARAAQAATPAKYERRIVKRPGFKLVKTTMKLENETFFKKNSSHLTQSAIQNLNKIAQQIRSHGYVGAIRITGNTCGLGSAKYDQKLSERRAKEVRDYMVAKGINPKSLISRGLGKNHPKYIKKDTGFKNRRVDIEFVTERSAKKQNVGYKNVLLQPGHPAIEAKSGRAFVPAVAGSPARFVWKTEVIKTAPVWIKRALHNTIRHNKTVSTYSTRASQRVTADRFVATGQNNTLDVLANDSAGLTLESVTQATNGTVTIVGNRVVYVPNSGFSGTDRFTYTVKDRNGKLITTTVTMDVPTVVNNVPVAVVDSVSTDENIAVLINVLANDTDADGDTLSINSTTNPANGTIAIVNGKIKYTPNTAYFGTDTFTYTVVDSNGNVSPATTVTVIVADVNGAPIAVNDAKTTEMNTPTTINVLSNDSDVDGDTLSVVSKTNPGNGSVSLSGGTFTYTPNNNYTGTDTFDYTITDGNGHNVTATVTITIVNSNVAPDAVNDSASTHKNTAVSINVLSNDTDANGDTLTVISNTSPAHGIVILSGGIFTYTPNNNYSGSDSFNYTISDANGHNVTATVMVNIVNTNAAPVALNDTNSTNKNTPVTFNVLSNDSDIDGDTLSVVSNTNPANGALSVSGGNFTYTPNNNYSGVDSFTYTISDGNGHNVTATVSINVVDNNTAPSAVSDATTTDQNTAVAINVLSNDTDIDGDTLSVISYTNPSNGGFTLNGGVFTYTPNNNFTGTDSFNYTISDGNGQTATASVTITIAVPNQNPVAVDDTASTAFETPVVINVVSNDYDPDSNSVCVSGIAMQAGNGSAVASANGSDITYTPNSGFSGVDTFMYTACDGVGGSATATVSVTVAVANRPPVLSPNYAAIQGYFPVTIRVLADDTDPDGDQLTITRTHSGPAHGTVSISGSDIIYTATYGYVGTDVFYYEVSDGNGHLVSERVDIDVQNNNQSPVIAPIPAMNANLGGTTTMDISAYLSDSDGDLIRVAVADALAGSITFSGAIIQYTPNPAEVSSGGSDTIYITVSDGNGGITDSIITVKIL
jgi:outer membrane protein OmpA-like peptidoglycan-associated protein